MGDRHEPVRWSRRLRAQRAQQMTVIYAVMTCLVLLIVIQFLLLMVAVEGFQGGRAGVLIPATAASGVCFAAACWVIRYILFKPSSTTRE